LKSLKMGIISSGVAKTGIKILPIHHFAQILRDGILKNALFLSGTNYRFLSRDGFHAGMVFLKGT
ncbi:hypothetical protein, partial [Acidithiobacillus albertensis]|uniref:hypothetical protein n=1 Tax=Acidithiobacillus albertensis TaxID=119978 RepID=UPI001C07BB0F